MAAALEGAPVKDFVRRRSRATARARRPRSRRRPRPRRRAPRPSRSESVAGAGARSGAEPSPSCPSRAPSPTPTETPPPPTGPTNARAGPDRGRPPRRRPLRLRRCPRTPAPRARRRGQRREHRGAAPRRRMHHEGAVGELDPFAHRGEPDPPRLQELASFPGVEPDPVVHDLDPELAAPGVDGHVDGGRPRASRSSRAPPGRSGTRASRGRGGSPGGLGPELGPHAVVPPVAGRGSPAAPGRARAPPGAEAQAGHEAAEVVGFLRELPPNLREHLESRPSHRPSASGGRPPGRARRPTRPAPVRRAGRVRSGCARSRSPRSSAA